MITKGLEPGPPMYPPSNSSLALTKPTASGPHRSRTPSPTRSENNALGQKGIFNVRASIANRSKKEKIWISIGLFIFLVIAILIAVFQKHIVDWLQPTANKIHNYPKLVGHEIVIILVGVIWGLWKGFAIAAAGTLLGEICNFFVFKYMCHARGEKYERTKIDYACFTRVVRDGGLKVAIIARYSIIPQHFTTAVFATCGMKFWVFILSAIVSLPRHFATVYIGVALEDETSEGSSSAKEKIIGWVVFGVTVVVSVFALRYINRLSDGVKADVIYQRRKARQAKDGLSSPSYSSNVPTPMSLEAGNYTVNVPLGPHVPTGGYRYGRGDGRGY